MASELSEHERLYFKKMFDLYDTDKGGTIGLSELRNLSKHLGVELTNEQLLESVRVLGISTTNGEVDLEFPEFLRWLNSASNSNTGDEFAMLKAKITAQGAKALNNEQIARLKEVFDHFDADGSGSIDAEELGVLFQSMGQEVTKEELEEMINGVDDDGSGQIEFNEFMLLMCTNFGGETFETEMQQQFESHDPDHTGLMPVAELAAMMKDATGGMLSDKEIKEIIDSAEPKNGMVHYMNWECLWEACREDEG